VKLQPSEYFRRQVFATFIDDPVGVASRDLIGVPNIMWSSDYPHTVSTWPHSREVVERDFKGVPEGDKRLIVRENAARLYGFALEVPA
jgi:predicted TIM-barrel fold metal-dependent hydrolase